MTNISPILLRYSYLTRSLRDEPAVQYTTVDRNLQFWIRGRCCILVFGDYVRELEHRLWLGFRS